MTLSQFISDLRNSHAPIALTDEAIKVIERAWEEATKEAADIVVDSPSFFTAKDRFGLAQAIRARMKEISGE